MTEKKSPHNGPGRPKDLAKRAAILDAAQCLFLRHGYDGSSMDAIAAEAGVSKLTVYSHFTDKETLFSAAVTAKCQAQLPELLFELPPDASVERVLRNIGLRFNTLINTPESIELYRLMMTLASQNPKLSQLFFEAGPQSVHDEMEGLLRKADQAGVLRIAEPARAAEHFLCLIKGAHNFRLLVGCSQAMREGDAERHVDEVVELFVRAYRV
ncbi:TetR/AcrR family transcriptional regulator [Pseudomonas sp. RIT-PI-AD]|uniref:TetR/AcrR family transcriptional regulator n=1 Tax=Pseudomonas sp. RIT-PI-AD TaxID=3035294 RepID=UPI0021DA2651|nr:TetR/AcrR family transcriptional regulator [Pseudomonas sp. RIT-PI-AD]